MSSLLMRLAVHIVRTWTLLYTWHMPPALRENRRAEIESDLWEFQQDAAREHDFVTVLHILVRLMLGIPDDLGWRVEQEAAAGSFSHGGFAVFARVAGGALFVGALWVIDSDVSRRPPVHAFRPTAFNHDRQRIDRSSANGLPTGDLPPLTTGIMATVGASMMPVLTAQSAKPVASSPPVFDAASIKPNKSGSALLGIVPQAGGRFRANNVSVGLLIRYAYQFPGFRVAGGPEWMESARFDVVATAGYDAPQAELRSMLQALLAERFQLAVHTEMREQPIYELVMARSDRRLGSQLRQSALDCTGQDWPNPLPPGPSVQCGFIGPDPNINIASGRSRFALRGTSMDGLARFLQAAARRAVVDRTALIGYFDGEFDFASEIPPPPPPPGSGIQDPYDRTNLQSIFTIVQGQLGLKLQSTRGPVDLLVIDRVEQPSPD